MVEGVKGKQLEIDFIANKAIKGITSNRHNDSKRRKDPRIRPFKVYDFLKILGP